MKIICARDRLITEKEQGELCLVHSHSLTGRISKYLTDKACEGQGHERQT